MQGDETRKRSSANQGGNPLPPKQADIEHYVHICRSTLSDAAFLDRVLEQVEKKGADAGIQDRGGTREADPPGRPSGVLQRLQKMIADAARSILRL